VEGERSHHCAIPAPLGEVGVDNYEEGLFALLTTQSSKRSFTPDYFCNKLLLKTVILVYIDY